MYIKIYFNDKPLFLCDKVEPEIEPILHHDDAIFMDDFSLPGVKSMIHEMLLEKVHAGVYLHTDLEELKSAFWKRFKWMPAGGGLVLNERDEPLFIFRRGKWDLPKGKLDKGEAIEACAIREVKEETGLIEVVSEGFLLHTYHTYYEGSKLCLKETTWFKMRADSSQALIPQEVEQISEIGWMNPDQLADCLKNTFPSVAEVVERGG